MAIRARVICCPGEVGGGGNHNVHFNSTFLALYFLLCGLIEHVIPQFWLSVIGGLDYWNGLLEWTTGMDFDLFFLLFFPQELTIYIEELV